MTRETKRQVACQMRMMIINAYAMAEGDIILAAEIVGMCPLCYLIELHACMTDPRLN